jgi:hypothetical protein
VTSASLTPDVITTLSLVTNMTRDNQDDWWIIAGAAAALHGAKEIIVGDVDVLMSARDAETVLQACGIPPMRDSGNKLFRSAIFGQWRDPPLTVEIMADFDHRVSRSWRRVAPVTREKVRLDGFDLFVPDRAELTAMFRAFGRPKDLERARLLEGT